MSGSRLRPYFGPVVALLVVLALGAGTVYAAIPNGDGKYYACRVSNTGVVKLINYPKVKTCQAGEKLISWNAKGPQGPAGPVGAQGPKGDQGPKGPAGPADWNAISNIPADFADGVDDDSLDYFSYTVAESSLGSNEWVEIDMRSMPTNAELDFTAIPKAQWMKLTVEVSIIGEAGGTLWYVVRVANESDYGGNYKLRARVYPWGFQPASVKTAIKAVKSAEVKIGKAHHLKVKDR